LTFAAWLRYYPRVFTPFGRDGDGDALRSARFDVVAHLEDLAAVKAAANPEETDLLVVLDYTVARVREILRLPRPDSGKATTNRIRKFLGHTEGGRPRRPICT
jgi:hypothetical protein